MKCKFCGREIKGNNFDSWFKNPDDHPCSTECKQEQIDKQKKVIDYDMIKNPDHYGSIPGHEL